jgi:hypothetical protein
MFVDREPMESGFGGIPTIAAPGRTIFSNFSRFMLPDQAAEHTIYGIRFKLGNMTTSPISGGKMMVGWANGWNGQWYPRVNGVDYPNVTGNWMAGWQRATVGGDPALPVPAADPGIWPLRTVWTNGFIAPSGFALNTPSLEIMTRFVLPPRSVAPYALTYGMWDEGTLLRFGTLAGRGVFFRNWRLAEDEWDRRETHGRWEGDAVTDPVAAGNMGELAGFNDVWGPLYNISYGPPGPVHTPLLEIQYATSLEEALSWD